MKVKEVIQKLKTFNQEAEFLISSDEELNTIYEGFEIKSIIDGTDEEDKVLNEEKVVWKDNNKIVIFPLSGTELEE